MSYLINKTNSSWEGKHIHTSQFKNFNSSQSHS